MTYRKLVTCFAFLTVLFIGNAGSVFADDEYVTDAEAVEITQPPPVTDLITPQETVTEETPEDCCYTKGVPECGGSCDVCCKTPQHALCVAGGCNANNPFDCTCDVTTSCSCK